MNNQERNTATVLDREDTTPGQHVRDTPGELLEPMLRAGQDFKESLGQLGTRIGTVRDNVVGKTKDYWRTTDNYVARNPWVAVGVSAGVAFLAGMLIGRRRSD
jgi:ElaB/YqjD/DUF883 family membrane-anchored ribosome-binding protein